MILVRTLKRTSDDEYELLLESSIEKYIGMVINGNFVLRKVAGEILLVPVRETAMRINGVFTLNDTGAVIWKGIEDGKSREEIIDTLTTIFNVDTTTAEEDCDEYISALINAGFIRK